ncbi:MAG: sensor domain-containing protein [Solirubrobacteraceae bacterium]
MTRDTPEHRPSDDRPPDHFRGIVESIPGIVFIAPLDPDSSWLYVNEWIEPILGFTVAEWQNGQAMWKSQLHPDDRERVLATETRRQTEYARAADPAAQDRRRSIFMDYRMLHKDGRTVWIRDRSVLVNLPDGTVVWQGVMMDVTDQKKAQAQLQRAAAAQAVVAKLGRLALTGLDFDSLVSGACASLQEVLGADNVATVQAGEEVSVFSEPGGDGLRLEMPGLTSANAEASTVGRYVMESGTPVLVADWEQEEHLRLSSVLVPLNIRASITARIEGPDRPWGVLAVTSRRARAFSEQDVSFVTAVANTLAEALVRNKTDEEMQHRALHDPLTGLPNRVLFSDRLSHAIERSLRREQSLSAVLFVDVDHFKSINDTLGHHIGDELLVQVASRLREVVRPTDTVSRFGGDEFGVLLEEIASERDAIATAERIAASFARPFVLETSSHFVSVSIGVALADGQSDAQLLLDNADQAMYRAKQRGRARYDLFDEDLRARALARARLESDLQRALERREMRLEYQPIVRLGTEAIYAAEALLRWDHPQRGPLNPDEFIPVAAESGLSERIGQWMLREALRDSARWQQQFPDIKPFCLGVNVSVQQLHNPRFTEILGEILAATGTDPFLLNLELDEQVLRADAANLHRQLYDIKRLGVRLLVHNFGTGTSSLPQLARLPIDAIKIDRRLITRQAGPDEAARISRSVVAAGLALGLSVVGLGVETAEEAEELRSCGASAAQGRLYSAAVSAEEITQLIRHPGQLRRTLV